MKQVVTQTVKIGNSQGLHARPASLFVKLASNFTSEVILKKDGQTVNGKSMMGVLTLAAEGGSTVEIQTTGVDAQAAMEALSAFLMGDQDVIKGNKHEEN